MRSAELSVERRMQYCNLIRDSFSQGITSAMLAHGNGLATNVTAMYNTHVSNIARTTPDDSNLRAELHAAWLVGYNYGERMMR